MLLVEQNVPLTLDTASAIYFLEKGVDPPRGDPSAESRADDAVIHQYLGV